MKKYLSSAIIVMILVVIILMVFKYNSPPTENNPPDSGTNQSNVLQQQDSFSKSEFLHWTHMPLTYQINNPEICELEDLYMAFAIIENVTDKYVGFKEVNANPDMNITCLNLESEQARLKNNTICKYFSAEEEKPSTEYYSYSQWKKVNVGKNETVDYICFYERLDKEVLGSALFDNQTIVDNKIFSANIKLYTSNAGNNLNSGTIWVSCKDFPLTVIHEILHSFGYGHSSSNYLNANYDPSIMSPYMSCTYIGDNLKTTQKSIDLDIVSCLKNTYSNGQVGTCSQYL